MILAILLDFFFTNKVKYQNFVICRDNLKINFAF